MIRLRPHRLKQCLDCRRLQGVLPLRDFKADVRDFRVCVAKAGWQLFASSSAPTALAAIAVSAPMQVVVAALAVPVTGAPHTVPRRPAATMMAETIAPPMHVVVPATGATPLAQQKRPPWHLALLTLHNSIR